MDSERTLLQKIVLWAFLALAVIFTAVNIILHQMPGVPLARGDWLFYGMAVFFSLIFALYTAFPYAFFYLKHSISVRDPEPSDFYLLMQKVGSVVSLVFVFIVYMIGVSRIV